MPNVKAQQILAGFPSHPVAQDLRKVVTESLAISDRFERRRAEVDKDGRLSPKGRTDALSDALVKTFGHELRDAKRPIAKARSKLEALRDSVRPPSSDPQDFVAALLRMEIRGQVVSLPPGQRPAFVIGAKDRRIAEAVLDAPAELSGLSAEVFGHVQKAYLETHFGEQHAEIEALEQAVESAAAAAQLARDDMMRASGMDARQFDEKLAPVEQRSGVPWLRRNGTGGVDVVDIPNARGRPATEDEIRNGEFFANYEAYVQAGGEPASYAQKAA